MNKLLELHRGSIIGELDILLDFDIDSHDNREFCVTCHKFELNLPQVLASKSPLHIIKFPLDCNVNLKSQCDLSTIKSLRSLSTWCVCWSPTTVLVDEMKFLFLVPKN